jgi:transposase-like protein
MVVLPRGEVCSSRRRRWSEEDKGRIVAESFEKGLTASDVARRHDISPQQLSSGVDKRVAANSLCPSRTR